MPSSKSAFAMLATVIVLLAGVLFATFSVFGPTDRWRNGPVGMPLALETGAATPERPAAVANAPRTAPPAGERPEGQVSVGYQTEGLEALQTSVGDNWTQGQGLFVRTPGGPWRRLTIPDGFVVRLGGIVKRDGKPALLVSRWNGWTSNRSFGRLARGIFAKEERPDFGLYLVDAETGAFAYLFPGAYPAVSPDGRVALFDRIRSADHELVAWDAETGQERTVARLRERDPGSGVSFQWEWTATGTAAIAGYAQGPGDFRLEYDPAAGTLKRVDGGR